MHEIWHGLESTVERALGLGHYDEALGALLTEWDRTRSPALATLIQRVSDRATAALDPVPSLPQKGALRDWVELARRKRPSDVGRLLASLLKVMAAGPSRLAVPRLDELLVMPPDPRIAVAIFEALRGPIQGWSDKGFVRAVKVLVRHGDVSVAEELQAALDARTADYMTADDRARFDKVDAAWRKREALEDPPAAVLEAMQAALAAAPAPVVAVAPVLDGESFLRAIYADPASDERRAVYADFLGERDDPRGELITLQLDRAAGRGSPASEKREKALLKAHQTAWLGPLAAEIVVGETEWRRGFPVATKTKMTKLYQLEVSCSRPEWGTFERIEFQGAALITGVMTALEEARGVTETAVRRLVKAGAPPRLHTVGVVLPYDLDMEQQDAVTMLLSMPAIRRLELRMARWSRASSDGVAKLLARAPHLTGLQITGLHLADLGSHYAAILQKPRAGALRSLGWGPGWGFVLTASRKDDGRFTTLDLVCDPDAHAYHVANFAGQLARSLDEIGRFDLLRAHHATQYQANPVVQSLLNKVADNVEFVVAVAGV